MARTMFCRSTPGSTRVITSYSIHYTKLYEATGSLPDGVRPELGPDATGVGWVFQYGLEGDGYSLDQLRSIQDWYLKFELQQVPGVAEVERNGGVVKRANAPIVLDVV